MAYEIKFDEQHQIGIFRVFDARGIEEWQPAIDALLAHPQISRGVPILFDYLGINYIPTSQESRQFIDGYLQINRELGSSMAILIDEGAKYGIARMIEIVSGLHGATMRVFTDRDEAIAWLTGGRTE